MSRYEEIRTGKAVLKMHLNFGGAGHGYVHASEIEPRLTVHRFNSKNPKKRPSTLNYRIEGIDEDFSNLEEAVLAMEKMDQAVKDAAEWEAAAPKEVPVPPPQSAPEPAPMTTAQDDDEITDINPKDSAQHLRDTFITFIKSELLKPWQQQNEAEQSRTVARVEYMVQRAVVEVCQAIMSVDHRMVGATMGKMSASEKGEIKAEVKFGNLDDDQKIGLLDHLGAGITIVLMEPGDYNNFRSKVEIQKDEPALPLAEGTAPAETPQPDWKTVAAAVEPAAPPPARKDPFEEEETTIPPADAPDAGEVVDEEETAPPSQDNNLVDDSDEEDGELPKDELDKMINIPNPTTAQPAQPAQASQARQALQAGQQQRPTPPRARRSP